MGQAGLAETKIRGIGDNELISLQNHELSLLSPEDAATYRPLPPEENATATYPPRA